jgi:peroxiredoxin
MAESHLLRLNLSMRKLLSAVAALVLCAPIAFAQPTTPDVGAKAPAFTLKTFEGQPVSLAAVNQSGPVVLVLLRGYPGYQCPFCVRQVHDFNESAARFAALHAQILLVYPGPPADLDAHAKEFLSKQDTLAPNVHLVLDPDYSMTNLYGLRWDAPRETAYPSTFLLNPHGVIVFRKISRGHGDRTTAADTLAELSKAAAQH